MLRANRSALQFKHDPEKWAPVSRLREAVPAACTIVLRFGGRSQVGQDHAQKIRMIPKTGTGLGERLCCHNEVARKPIRRIVLSLIISLYCEVDRIEVRQRSGR
jgi:hypothetical protein